MTKKLFFLFCLIPFCTFAELSDFQISMLNSVDSLIIMTTNNTSTITTISSDSTYIISLAESIPSDSTYYQTAGHIIDLANHIDSMSSYLSGVNAQRYQNLIGLRETISNMSLDSSDLNNITNQLNYVCSRLDDIYSLFYSQQFSSYLYNIQTDLDLIQTYTYSIDSDVGSILTKLTQIHSYVSDMIIDVRTISNTLLTINTTLNSLNSNLSRIKSDISSILTLFLQFGNSWNNHANHQDNFYLVATNQLHEIISRLVNLSITNSNFDIDLNPITNIITNFNSEWFESFPYYSEYSGTKDYYFYQPVLNHNGILQSLYYQNRLGDIAQDFYYTLSPEGMYAYNPFLMNTLSFLFTSSALTSLVNWDYLLWTNAVQNLQVSRVVSSTLSDIESHTRDIIVELSTNNFIQSQQLSKLDYIQSLFSNNVPVASLNLDRQQSYSSWYDFFTNFYFNVSFGWDESGETPQYSSWQQNTNWFNRVEALLAALVFKDDKQSFTNTVSSSVGSSIENASQSLSSVVDLDGSYSQDFQNTSRSILDMLSSWNTEIQNSANIGESWDMFHIPHMDEALDKDSLSAGDWSIRVSFNDTPLGDFGEFIRSFTTVLWVCVFLFLAFRVCKFVIYYVCKIVYFCYVVFSNMLGGD